MGDFKLSASLEGHEDDVRAVAFPHASFVLSASRDATVRLWKQLSSSPPSYDNTLISHGTSFVNSLAYVPPSSDFPDGLVVSGGKDAIIEARAPGKPPHDNADGLLLGHSANVCSLNIGEDGRTIVSGGWDAEARVWQVGRWEATAVLQGHQGSVWAVLAYDRETIITGCADKLIRVFHPSGKLLRTIKGGPDVVRALCKMPQGHPSGAQFASAGNDAVIRFWTLEGHQIAELYGHESFIYSLAVLPSGELVSSSEDRTARVWKADQCIQTITHPAISVWSVAACADNGDIVTGASDRVVRVFSRASDRQADPDSIQQFENSVKSSSIPQQQVGNINKEKLPGPEFIHQKSGTKEGQVQMIREPNGNIAAYQWSMTGQQWINVGTVVDAAGSSGKKITYNGQDYDYVFDVDIEDGKPPLKLPYNLSQNPYEVARKFIADNELPVTYLDQVANFIVTNTQGATLGQSQTQAPGSDPWGTESRYRPGEVDAPSGPPPAASRPKALPQTQYLSIATANLKTISKKIAELNSQLVDQGRKDLALNPHNLSVLDALAKQLDQAQASAEAAKSPANPDGIDLALRIATSWPPDNRLPGLDLLRLLATSPTLAAHTSSDEDTIVDILAKSGVFEATAPTNNTMLAVRVLANLFTTNEGRLLVDGSFEQVRAALKPHIDAAADGKVPNRNLAIALATLYINYAVLAVEAATGGGDEADRPLELLEDLVSLLKGCGDAEALYRALVGAGTALSTGDLVRAAAREVLGLPDVVGRAERVGKEGRIKGVAAEIRDILKEE
ncbi:PUL domain-containing protein [Lineolata rhizophorae]|uniref:PUL domain-containing protein n=1 Tax=Lineolata rhizophorae TaxID=578093 RepID=A0A6A6NQT5_9PEZI|nr:PUL domain-containing protein [Lineolata rhizophorae]